MTAILLLNISPSEAPGHMHQETDKRMSTVKCVRLLHWKQQPKYAMIRE